MKNALNALVAFLMFSAIVIATLGAWIQHFVTTVAQELWVLLVVGAIIPPVGVLHGWLVWMGVL